MGFTILIGVGVGLFFELSFQGFDLDSLHAKIGWTIAIFVLMIIGGGIYANLTKQSGQWGSQQKI